MSMEQVHGLPVNETIVVAFPPEKAGAVEAILNDFDQTGFHVKVIPSQRSRVLGLTFDDFFGLPLLSMNTSSMSPSGVFFKRILDLLGSLFGLIVLSPLLLLLALLTKLSSKGPVFYSQDRIGLDGRRFKLYKYRTMKVGADKVSQWTVEGDSRTTKFGAFLRKTSLDELPQLWNIFKGEMSIVGPRPEQPNFVIEFKKEIPNYMLRHRMKAGLTGWAQIHGFRGDTDLTKRIEYDLEYIRMWSIWLDLKIILLTMYKGLFNKNAY
jgi:exopolysaccharide biosynthesis polyprenyl glycosylphosphotransferase